MEEPEPIMIVYAKDNQIKSRYNQKQLNILELIGFLSCEIERLKRDAGNLGEVEE